VTARPEEDAPGASQVAEAPRPDNLVALALPVWVETSVAGPAGEGNVSGYAIALGWNTPQRSSAYLISDDSIRKPVWVAESDLVSNSVRRPS
jgi:hypothetical protein